MDNRIFKQLFPGFQGILQILLLIAAGLLYGMGTWLGNYNCMVFGNVCLFVSLGVFCCAALKRRIVLLIFDFTMFVFLACRPVIDFFRGTQWWTEYTQPDVLFALRGVGLSVLTIYAGAVLYEWLFAAAEHRGRLSPRKPDNKHDMQALQLSALCLYAVSMPFYLFNQMDKLLFIQGRAYEDLYILYQSSYPDWFYTVEVCMPFALCAFLATMPRKRLAFPVLAVFLLSAVPQLIIGIRNPIVLNAIFIFLYYFIRDALGDSERWLGKWEIGLVIVMIPVACLGLGAINYIREGKIIEQSVFGLLVDLFHKQGVSFRTLCVGHGALPYLPGEKRLFSTGSIVDNVLFGRLGNLLFGTTPLPGLNSVEMAERSHSLSHAISYVAHPGYLEGHGLGSSFVLELFADFGYVGVALFSLVLGAAMVFCMDAMKKGWFWKTVILTCMLDLFFIPRASALDCLAAFVQIHFWFIMIACLVGEKIFHVLLPKLQGFRERKI